MPSLTDERARERNREAADRTLLAWIRTSLAMISLGFAIERAGQVAHVMDGRLAAIKSPDYRYPDRPAVARRMGVALVLVGLAALVVILAF